LDNSVIKRLREKKKKNFESRLKFVDFCVDKIKKDPKNYFKAHKQFIDSMY